MTIDELKERFRQEREIIADFYRALEKNEAGIERSAAELVRIREAIEELENGHDEVQGRGVPGEE